MCREGCSPKAGLDDNAGARRDTHAAEVTTEMASKTGGSGPLPDRGSIVPYTGGGGRHQTSDEQLALRNSFVFFRVTDHLKNRSTLPKWVGDVCRIAL